ncbi:hypothetical protein [Nocardioides sp. GXQ0305]
MASNSRELLLGAALALWFPVALAVTDAASSEPGEVGTPATPGPTASR